MFNTFNFLCAEIFVLWPVQSMEGRPKSKWCLMKHLKNLRLSIWNVNLPALLCCSHRIYYDHAYLYGKCELVSLTCPLLSNVLFVNLILLKQIGCACQCEPNAGLSGWMYMRCALCGSAPPAGAHWLFVNLYRQSLNGAISSTIQ